MTVKKQENIVVPEDWKKLLKKIKRHKPPNIIFVIGAVDTGKSVLSQFLYRQLSKADFAALIDSDLGQSTIGPPTTVGLAAGKGAKSTLSPIKKIDKVKTIQFGSIYFKDVPPAQVPVLKERP